ncbi:MAG TPA: cytochrome c3 family protein [Fimbriimonadaceae bacterium]|nr:cytochrome c3 family protein [Fimbriimonadaceae bacterium]
MKHWFQVTKRWSLVIASAATLTIGAMALLSCGGEGGPIHSGGGGGGGNSFTAQFLALLPSGQAGATYVGPTVCKTCHDGTTPQMIKAHGRAANPNEPYYDEWSGTAHAANNVTCEQCHGPGSNHANSATPDATTILGVPKSNSPIICAQCHGPIYDDWNGTAHAQILADPVNISVSQARSSRCIQCHSGLFRTETAEQGIDVGNSTQLPDAQITQFETWAINNVPNTANCATCHNPHKATSGNNPSDATWQGQEAQLRHQELNTDTTQVAAPATAATFVNFDQVCAECHNGRGMNPADSNLSLASATSRFQGHASCQYNMLMGTGGVEGSGTVQRNMAHATAPGQCAHCHMPNSSHTYTVSYDVSCQPCHTGQGAADNANSVKTTMINGEYALLTRLESWATTKFGQSTWWDYTSNITTNPTITTAQEATVPIQVREARYNYYMISIDNSYGPHNFPYATTLLQVANSDLDALGVPGAASRADLTTAQKLQILRSMRAQALKNMGESN